ncbi:MAG TPA: VOC family protein [Terriglobales bacterium]
MKRSEHPVPPGFHTVTASLTVKDSAAAIDYYKKALGAEEIMRMASPDGKITHAELKIGDSIIFLNDEIPGWGSKAPETLSGVTGSIYLYVEDADKSFERAVGAGAKVVMPVMDMFWGDRLGSFVDPFGHAWAVSTHTQDMTEEEMEQGAKAFHAQMAQMAQQKKTA